jgi:hypothetical protein
VRDFACGNTVSLVGGLAAFGAIGALGGVHDLLTVRGLCDLRHSVLLKCNRFVRKTAAVLVVYFWPE